MGSGKDSKGGKAFKGGKGKSGKDFKGCKGGEVASATTNVASGASGGGVFCKFFGSAKGCEADAQCEFSHESPNSVPPCSFKQKLGNCQKGEACTFRHIPWSSADHARRHYASRDGKDLELSKLRYQQLHRNGEASANSKKLSKEHLELPVEKEVEKDIQEETYGSKAMRMMEKMGYKAGVGLGKQESGGTKLADPCLDLERASQAVSLGFGNFDPASKATAAERAARLADARAREKKRPIGEVEHNLLSDDESSDGEDAHRKVRNVQL